MAEAPDVEILSRAAAEGRIIATLDADFHSLLAHSGESSPSVIRIRDEGLKGPDVVRILMAIADATAADLSDGCVISYSEGRYA